MKTQVFISYSSEETQLAYKVRDRLTKNQISCWMAPDSIAPGASYMSEIPKGIKECEFFLLLLSECAQNSNWVIKELETAISAGKKIVPFIINECAIREEFAFMLSNVQYWYAYNSMEEQLQKLVTYFQEKLGIEPVVLAVTEEHKTDVKDDGSGIEVYVETFEKKEKREKKNEQEVLVLLEKASAWDLKGKKLREIGRNAEAYVYLEKALQCKEEAYGSIENIENVGRLWDLSVIYNTIGDVLDLIGKHAEAVEYFRKSMLCMEKACQVMPSLKYARALSVSYRNTGQQYYKLGMYEEALAYFEKEVVSAKEIHDKAPGTKGFKKLSLGYDDLGKTYHSLGQAAKALVCYQKALKNAEELIRLSPEMVNQKILANAYANVGELYSELEEYDEAIAACERAVLIMREVYMEKPSDFRREDLWRVLMIQADVHFTCGRMDDSLEKYEVALDVCKKLYEKDDTLANARKYIHSLRQISVCLAKQSRFSEAAEYKEKAIAEAELLCLRSDEEADEKLLGELKRI